MAKEKQSPTREQQPTTSKNKNLTPCVSSTPSLFSFFNLKNSQLGMSVSSSFTVTVAEESVASGKVALSPLDLSTRGRSVPSIWYFKKSLDPFALVSSRPLCTWGHDPSTAQGTFGTQKCPVRGRGTPCMTHSTHRTPRGWWISF